MLTQTQREHLELIRASAGGTLAPQDVLTDARNPNSPLHDLFLWNDSEAAEAYRLIQAREVVRVVVRMAPRPAQETTRVVVKRAEPRASRPAVTVVPRDREAATFKAISEGIDRLAADHETPHWQLLFAEFRTLLAKHTPASLLPRIRNRKDGASNYAEGEPEAADLDRITAWTKANAPDLRFRDWEDLRRVNARREMMGFPWFKRPLGRGART
jgi:hypothetical protein